MQDFTRAAYTTVLAPDEIVTRIEIPRASARARFGFHKLCRKTGELAEAMGVVLVDPERRYCRVVAGAVGAKPVPLPAAARSLAATAARPSRCAARRDRRLHRRARPGEAAHGRGRGAPGRRRDAGATVTHDGEWNRRMADTLATGGPRSGGMPRTRATRE